MFQYLLIWTLNKWTESQTKNDTWKFKSVTENDMLVDSLVRYHSNKTAFIEFYQWEKAFQSLLYQCFARVRPQKNKSTNQSLDVYERLREVDNLIKSKQSSKNQREEKEVKLLD